MPARVAGRRQGLAEEGMCSLQYARGHMRQIAATGAAVLQRAQLWRGQNHPSGGSRCIPRHSMW
eukprot:1190636-Prorocentrum_minimum.AAC.2